MILYNCFAPEYFYENILTIFHSNLWTQMLRDKDSIILLETVAFDIVTQKLNIIFSKQLITKNDRLTCKSQTSHSYAHNKQQNLIYTKRRFKQLRKMVQRHFNSWIFMKIAVIMSLASDYQYEYLQFNKYPIVDNIENLTKFYA